MNNLLSKLLEEAERVNALEVEVVKAVKEKDEEISKVRNETSKEIGEFLDEMIKALDTAKHKGYVRIFMPYKNGERQIVLKIMRPGAAFFERGFESASCYPQASLYYFPLSIIPQSMGYDTSRGKAIWATVCDNWTQEVRDIILSAVSDEINATLAKRTEEMTVNLKEANDRYAQKFGGAK